MKNNKVVALIILILVFVLAACGGGEANTETTTEQTTTENTAVQSDNTEVETAVSLADEVRVDEGGFAFQPPVGFDVSTDSLFAELVASDDPDTQINLFGFPLMAGMDLNAMYDGATAEFASDDSVSLSEREDISINGLKGFSATMSGEEDGKILKGKIVILGNDAQGVFVLVGAEESKWDGGVAEQADAVINSISLFEIAMPELMEEEALEEPVTEEVESVEETEEVEPEADASADFDTVFPLPADAVNIIGEGADADLNFQTSLTLEEALDFYRTELIAQGLVERDLLTVVEESVISVVFDGSENGKAIVIQGVDLGEITNISLRFEDS